MDSSNCLPENLEWVTHAENVKRSYQNNKKRKSGGPVRRTVRSRTRGCGGAGDEQQKRMAFGEGSPVENKLQYIKGYRFEYVPPSADIDYGEWHPVTQVGL